MFDELKPEIIESVEQGSEEWFEMRKGVFTGSLISALMTYEKTPETLPAGAISNITNNAIELLYSEGDNFSNSSTDWGNKYENEAAEYFSIRNGLKIKEVTFVKLGDHVGTSPDRLIGDNEGLELKCPEKVKHHLKWRLANTAADVKKIDKKYYCQVVHNLFVTRRDAWYFASYDPRSTGRLRMFQVKMNRTDEVVQKDLELLETRLKLAIEKKNEIYNELILAQ